MWLYQKIENWMEKPHFSRIIALWYYLWPTILKTEFEEVNVIRTYEVFLWLYDFTKFAPESNLLF